MLTDILISLSTILAGLIAIISVVRKNRFWDEDNQVWMVPCRPSEFWLSMTGLSLVCSGVSGILLAVVGPLLNLSPPMRYVLHIIIAIILILSILGLPPRPPRRRKRKRALKWKLATK